MFQKNEDRLVAHNNLDGARWNELAIGDRIYYAYQAYEVIRINRYQALTPDSPKSLLKNLDTGETLIVDWALLEIRCDNCISLQTCIAKDGNPSWGRLFVIAKEIPYVNPAR